MAVRLPRIALVLAAGLTIGLVGVATIGQPSHDVPSDGPPPTHAPVGRAGALAVLHDWDVRRAAAWAASDPDALAGLYAPGSRAGAADVALLRRYARRGLAVRDLGMQVLQARVLVSRPRRLELEVTDRLAAGVAVRAEDPAAVRRLPEDAPATRVLVLRRSADRWLMVRVSAAPDR